MTKHLTITKLKTDDLLVTSNLAATRKPYTLKADLSVYLTEDGVDLYEVNRHTHTFKTDEVLNLVRKDGTVVSITTAQQLFDELRTYFLESFGQKLLQSNLQRLLKEADDLEITYNWIDTTRVSPIVYSSVLMGLTITETITYTLVSGEYRPATITLS